MKPTTIAYIKGWLLFSVIELLVGVAFTFAFALLTLRVLEPARLSLTEIGAARLVAGFAVGLPVSFFAYRWSVARCVVKSLKHGATTDQAA